MSPEALDGPPLEPSPLRDRLLPLLVAALLLAPGVAPASPSPPAPDRRAASGETPADAAVRSDAEVREAVAEADRALGRAVASHDVTAFRALLADDVLLLGASAARGRDAAVAAWEPLLRDGGPDLAWDPEEVVVAAAGDLAVSIGGFRFTPRPDDPTAEPSTGTYLSVWQHVPGAGWRLAADGTLLGARRRAVTGAAEALDLPLEPPTHNRIETTTAPEVRSASGDLAYGVGTLTVHFEAAVVATPGGPAADPTPTVLSATAPHFAVWTGSDRTEPTWEAVGSFRRDE